jgi:hypothetical protein
MSTVLIKCANTRLAKDDQHYDLANESLRAARGEP